MLIKYIRYEPHALVLEDRFPRGAHDTRAFLAPVLQGVEPKIGQPRGILVAEHPKNATRFIWLVE